METEEEYQEAALKWIKENPGKTVNDVTNTCQVTLENGKVINVVPAYAWLTEKE